MFDDKKTIDTNQDIDKQGKPDSILREGLLPKINETEAESKVIDLELKDVSKTILSSLQETQCHYGGFCRSLFKQRLQNGFGSRYKENDPQTLQEKLFNEDTLSQAQRFIPPESVQIEDCRYYTIPHPENLEARVGMIKLCDVPADTKIRWIDSENTGKWYAVCEDTSFDDLASVKFSTVIIKPVEIFGSKVNCILGFFPGEPVDPKKSVILGEKPTITTAGEAIEAGILYAKTCEEKEWNKIK